MQQKCQVFEFFLREQSEKRKLDNDSRLKEKKHLLNYYEWGEKARLTTAEFVNKKVHE